MGRGTGGLRNAVVPWAVRICLFWDGTDVLIQQPQEIWLESGWNL